MESSRVSAGQPDQLSLSGRLQEKPWGPQFSSGAHSSALVHGKGPAYKAPWRWAGSCLRVWVGSRWLLVPGLPDWQKPARKDRFCSPANTTQYSLHRLMLKGSRWQGCGVRSFLIEHSCANGAVTKGLPAWLDINKPLHVPQMVRTANPTVLQQEELQGHLLFTSGFQASQRKPCLAPQNSLQLVPTVQTCSESTTTPGNQTKAGKELERCLQNWREGLH